MPRPHRITHPAFPYHVFNRSIKGSCLFESPHEYFDFQLLLWQARERTPVRILAYCLMPNHWHLLLWPRAEGDLSAFMKWLATTHATRWNRVRRLTGRGAVYQSRFKSVPVEDERHLLRVWRYIEGNPVSAHLVTRAEFWQWSSLRCRLDKPGVLDRGPIELPRSWEDLVNTPQVEEEPGVRPPDKNCQGV